MSSSIVRLSNEQWDSILDLFPPVTNPRSRSNRECLDAILTAASSHLPNKWQSLKGSGLCPAGTAIDRFKKWWEAGVIDALIMSPLITDPELRTVDWNWIRNGGRNQPESH